MSTIKAKRKIVYETSDGVEHHDLKIARKHQWRIALHDLLDRDGVGRGGEWDQGMIGEWIEENFEQLKNLSSGSLERAK